VKLVVLVNANRARAVWTQAVEKSKLLPWKKSYVEAHAICIMRNGTILKGGFDDVHVLTINRLTPVVMECTTLIK
jgi:hypothetical protein